MSHKICPICHGPQTEKYAPFCSKRCADIDLQRWFSGAYAVPGEAEEEAGPVGSSGEDE
jgi:hypothetical protein